MTVTVSQPGSPDAVVAPAPAGAAPAPATPPPSPPLAPRLEGWRGTGKLEGLVLDK